MAERGFHLKRADHHFAAFEHLRADPKFHDRAAVALFYSALHHVDAALAGEASLPKDEQHPRKHSAPPTPGNCGRGRNQLVAQIYGAIDKEYRSLFEASQRTRYDLAALGGGKSAVTLDQLLAQYKRLKQFTAMQRVAQATPST